MMHDEVGHYLSEVHRVLKRKGRALMTMFVLDEESLRLVSEHRSAYSFAHERAGTFVEDAAAPEAAVAFTEETAIELLRSSGLQTVGPIRNGSWCGRTDALDFQDILIAERP
jgi:hypothetical protein